MWIWIVFFFLESFFFLVKTTKKVRGQRADEENKGTQ